ncbi:MAG: type I restriction-modification system endonuclease, partial [Selenomonadaceae bacterium]|nr:type I restriction-modification system endonuclease [Selenomonadaceae bacterium]
MTESETRKLIDEQLRKVGWEADTKNLRYSKGTRPENGRNIAIAEWKTNSEVGENGFVDYALFVGTKLVGLIEAKANYKNISSVIDYQCKDYAKNICAEDEKYLLGTWNNFRVPFIFATNGREYTPQLETMSGIWFQDLRKNDNVPKALRGWISPNGILELLEKNISAGNENLQKMNFDLLENEDDLNLRDYQLKAVQSVEKAIIAEQKNILLAMATGTGKTRTILGMIYRFLKSGRFRRILFLVDRNSLGEQAQDVFKEVKLEDLMTLEKIYNIQKLDDRNFAKETRLQVATVQSMVKRLLYNEENFIPSVTDYDLIIIDEAHRGYILDKEISADEENIFENQQDYQSKYRSVIEYFDAVKLALTATPALHTTKIFGAPVFKYSYREAVIDGWLADYDAPHILKTKLSAEGIHYQKGDNITIYNPATGEIENLELLEDELNFDIENFNRQVVNENFNRAVLEEIFKNFSAEGKTLIYAVDDKHADLIVKILKEIFSAKGVSNEVVMKITGSVSDKRRVQDAIRKFKNENYPSVVVTVDLLTTGIDVPAIDKLVFLRRVKSRILFEQMLGRATRLCPEIGKTHFEIFDAVGVYESLEPVSEMKP